MRLFPHGSLKKTLKRKGKHTKTNSYPLKEKKLPSRESTKKIRDTKSLGYQKKKEGCPFSFEGRIPYAQKKIKVY